MDELMIFERYKQAVVSSRVIADKFGKRHNDVVSAINTKIAWLTTEKFVVQNYFVESSFNHSGNKYKEYLLTRDGFSFIVMGFTGREADVWKLKYIAAFNSMERFLLEKQTAEWQQTRLQSKQARLRETDAIKSLVEYARAQGSQNAEKLYVVYSKLVKQLAGYENRDSADTDTLIEIISFERLLFGIITTEMTQNTPYKKIYQKAKKQLFEIRRLWLVPQLTA